MLLGVRGLFVVDIESSLFKEKFEDTKGLIRSLQLIFLKHNIFLWTRLAKKPCNKMGDSSRAGTAYTYNGQKQKDKQWSTKHYTEN